MAAILHAGLARPSETRRPHLTAGDVVTAIREQNVQVAAGQIGAPPSQDSQFQLAINAMGRLTEEQQFRDIIIKTGTEGEIVRLGDVSRIEVGAQAYAITSLLSNKNAVAIPIFQAPNSNALDLSAAVRKTMKELKKDFPEGLDYSIVYDPTVFVRQSIEAVVHTAAGSRPARGDRRHPLLADVARVDHPARRGSRLDHRHLRRAHGVRLLDQHPVAVRARAFHRYRRRRCHRGRRERGAAYRERTVAA